MKTNSKTYITLLFSEFYLLDMDTKYIALRLVSTDREAVIR